MCFSCLREAVETASAVISSARSLCFGKASGTGETWSSQFPSRKRSQDQLLEKYSDAPEMTHNYENEVLIDLNYIQMAVV